MPSLKNPRKVLADLREGRYAPVYFLQGEEVYYIDEITSYIEKNAVPSQNRSLSLFVCYGKETTLPQVISNAKALPMFGKRQVIIVKEAQNLTSLQRATGQKKIMQYLAQPNLHTILVFAYKRKTILGKAFQQAFAKSEALLFTTPRTYLRNIPEWVKNYLQAKGYTIVPQAIAMLQNLLGTHLSLLANELDKISLGLAKGGKIQAADIIRHVGMQKEMNVFVLQDAIIERKQEQALKILYYLVQNLKKNPAILTVSILSTFFCKLLRYHHLAGTPPETQVKALQIHPYFLKTYQKAARCHPVPAVLGHLQALYQADLKLKGIQNATIQEGEILKELVLCLVVPFAT
ncbi:MAG: DNA polymerase III subunit delta [Cytophagales bacterium]